MKRVFISIIALAAALNLCACGDKSEHKSKSKKETKSETTLGIEIETVTERTTKPGVVNEIAIVDPFETLSLSLDNDKSAYPECLDIKMDYGKKDFSEQIEYKAKLISADDDKIVVEVTANPDEAAFEELFGEMKYKINRDTREYELSIDDVPVCLLDRQYLTNENLLAIDKKCREKVDEGIKKWSDESELKANSNYEIVATFVSIGRISDYISEPIEIKTGINYFAGDNNDVQNNRVMFIYKSESNVYYVGTAEPLYLNGEMIDVKCSEVTDVWGLPVICSGLKMIYNSEEEAETEIEDWFNRMVVGYQEGDLVKIDNPT